MIGNRRYFLGLAAAAPFAALAKAPPAAAPAACFDPATLPMSQKGLRTSMQFVVKSTDPAKRCELCAFFKATTAGCGSCQILNGPVTSASLCASFAAKPK